MYMGEVDKIKLGKTLFNVSKLIGVIFLSQNKYQG